MIMLILKVVVRGIITMNVPTANTIAAVELTMTHMLSCMRKFPYAIIN